MVAITGNKTLTVMQARQAYTKYNINEATEGRKPMPYEQWLVQYVSAGEDGNMNMQDEEDRENVDNEEEESKE